MNTPLLTVARKRQLLIEKSDEQRVQMAIYIEHFRRPIQVIDTSVSVFWFFKLHPLLMLSSTFMLNQIRVRFLSKWVGRMIAIRNNTQFLKYMF